MTKEKIKQSQDQPFLSDYLLQWYDKQGRDLPWRLKGGIKPDPYHVWLSEIMLQQTTVATVKNYFHKFLKRWPTLEDLAKAKEEDVLHEWQGLGYYSRARNLLRCARYVWEELGGCFPSQEEALLKLPGIGAYTSAAISAIAFDQPSTIVDGNVIRVVSRLFGVTDPFPQNQKIIRELAQALTPQERAGDYAQAIMDLGATLCAPQNPSCDQCPWQFSCTALKQGRPEDFPFRLSKEKKPTRFGFVWWIWDEGGRFALVKRPSKGLLAHMMGLPTSSWVSESFSSQKWLDLVPFPGVWRLLEGEISHTFTHFHLRLQGVFLETPLSLPEQENYYWCEPSDLHHYALPTLMKKAILHGLQKQKKEGYKCHKL